MPSVLLTSVGRRVSLVRRFVQSIEELGLRRSVLAADASLDAPARYVANSHITLPRVDAPDFAQALALACDENDVDLVIPLIDTELPQLSRLKDQFALRGVRILVSSEQTIAIAHDKRRTSEFLTEHGFIVPKSFTVNEALSGRASFPLIVKPAAGSSSVGVWIVNSNEELRFHLQRTRDPIVQEVVTGREFTVDVLVDLAGKVRCAVPRLRIETRAGEVSKGMTVKDIGIMDQSRAVIEALPGTVGCITLQAFADPDGALCFIEVNPRFGGGFPLSAHAGADFTTWILELHEGREPRIPFDAWRDGTVMLRYDAEIIVSRATIQK